MTKDYTFGIEEEYFLVNAETCAISLLRPKRFFAAAKQALGASVMGEMLQSQIEVATAPHSRCVDARDELKNLRHGLVQVGREHGLGIAAAGTYPTAVWERAQQTPAARYDVVMDDLRMIGRRNMLCGMHVHVELPDPDARYNVMCRLLPYLPLFVALATSSPFWQSHRTGLKGYRLAAYDELPRTGLPELFWTRAEFDAYVAALTCAGVIEDASFLWWMVRPSLKHPTLELRAPDCCTRLDDTLALAALYRALVRHLDHNPDVNADLTPMARAVIEENKWRAQRYGVYGTFADHRGRGAVNVADMLAETLAMIGGDAQELGCHEDLEHCREIVRSGTSADEQLAIFKAHGSGDQDDDDVPALDAVNRWLVAETAR